MDDSDPRFPDLNRLILRSLADARPREREWVWQDWIPRGVLSLVLGQAGIGKTFLALELAAMATRGWQTLPSAGMRKINAEDADAAKASEKSEKRIAGTVIMFGCRDGESTISERLEAAGAILANVRMVGRPRRDDELADLNETTSAQGKKHKPLTKAEKDRELRLDLRSLQQQILQLQSAGQRVPLVIIDQVESPLRDALDQGWLIEWLNRLAQKTGAAIVVVGSITMTERCEFKLQSKGVEILRQVARAVLTIVQDLDNPLVKLVLPTKLNLSANRRGRKFEILHSGVIEWREDEVCLKCEQYLNLLKQRRKAASKLIENHHPDPVDDANNTSVARRRPRPAIPPFSIN